MKTPLFEWKLEKNIESQLKNFSFRFLVLRFSN